MSSVSVSIGSSSVAVMQQDQERFGYLSSFMVATDALLGALDKARDRISKNQLDLAKAHSNTTDGSADFLDLFEAELDRVTTTIQSQLDAQELSGKALLSNIGAVVKFNYSDEAMKGFRAKAAKLSDMCLKLQRFVARNAEILTEIGSKADKEIGTSSMVFLKRKLAVAPWIEGPNSALVVVLSDIYEDIRKAEDASKSKDSKWVAPSSFERSTTKYWIEQDKLTELMLAAVTEAPLLVYGRSGHLTGDTVKTEGNKLWDDLATPINSVYFDSPNMVMYSERIKRSEGAQLFRIRWYGDKPKGDEPVFLELKTHHEKWINVKSVKERVNILERDVKIFLSNAPWNESVATKLVKGAEPTMKPDKVKAQVTLITTMHELVIREHLRPCVRSMYARAAFQSPTSNALRLTLDRNVTLVDETRAPEGAWCLPDDAVISADMITRVPYPVFEIKLSDAEMPSTFAELIETGTLIEAPKFSKFLTGAASFNAEQLDTLPYWAEEPVFDGMFKKRTSAERVGSESDPAPANRPRSGSDGDTLQKMSKRMSTSVMAFTELFDSLPADILDDISDSELPGDGKKATEKESTNSTAKKAAAVGATAAVTAAAVKASKPAPAPAPAAAAKSAPAPAPAASSTGGDGGGGGPMGFFAVLGFGGGNKDGKSGHRKAARVEPKSFFANERTFIQWISAALLLVTISVILLDFQSGNNVPSTAGIVLNSVAVFIVFYSIYAYYRRLVLLQSASAYGYVDHVGPIILALSVLLGVIMLLYYYIDAARPAVATPSYPPGPVLTQSSTGGCNLHPAIGAPTLSFQPSGILLDMPRDQLLIPTLDRISSLSLASPNTPVDTLIRLPDTDLEAITVVPEGTAQRVFTLSEGSSQPILIEVDFTADGLLQEVNRWDLNMGNSIYAGLAEGLTYVPNPVGTGGLLYVAGDENDPLAPENRGVVNTFEVPPADGSGPSTLERTGALNSNLINAGLSDSKIGELLYFEQILYILNDNARLIRAWDLVTGTLLAQTILPRVGEGFDQQWEGLALQRPGGTTNLRGANTPLNVYLALDTPPQVWMFNSTMGAVNGSIVFPECAAAF